MMRPPATPATDDDLLHHLRSVLLLTGREARRLRAQWAADGRPAGGPAARARELADCGVLTPYQAGEVLAGRARALLLGRYCVLERLGGGGMGQVFKAEHRLMRRVVALKVVARLPRRGDAARAGALARFRGEVEAAARLRHPNIVTAYDAAAARGRLFLVMEYVDGVDLARLVAAHGPLPVPLACEAARQAALGLAYAHGEGLVHRDVKPSNLMLARAGGDGPSASLPSLPEPALEGGVLVKLLDLGLARRARAAAPPAAGGLDGTPDFMAPECGHGHAADVRSDLYSLGCTLYFLLTGQVPYPGGSWTEKLLRHRLDLPCGVLDLRPDVPAGVAAVVGRLMAKDAGRRYPDAAAAARALWDLAEHGWELPPASERPVCPSHEAAPDGPPAALPALPEIDLPAGETPTQPVSLPEVDQPTEPARPRAAAAAGPACLPGPWALCAAMLVGSLVGAGGRLLPGGPRSPAGAGARAPAAPRAAAPARFVVARLGREFPSLERAVEAARDGDTITVRGAGPFSVGPLDLSGKGLTLRAGPGARPALEGVPPGPDEPWRPLLAADRPLTLEGLDLRYDGAGPLAAVDRAALRLTDCRVSTSGGAPALVSRNGGELTLRGCRVEAGAAAVSAEVGACAACRVEVSDCAVALYDASGAALSVWAPEVCGPTDVRVALRRSTVRAGRVVAFRAVPGRLRVTAEGNDFSFRDGVLSFAGWGDPWGWRKAAAWQGRDNRYRPGSAWLSVEGRPAAADGLDGWRALWGGAEPDSSEAPPGPAATPRPPS
jgi:serine/threonine-protein kinase